MIDVKLRLKFCFMYNKYLSLAILAGNEEGSEKGNAVEFAEMLATRQDDHVQSLVSKAPAKSAPPPHQ